MKRLLASTAVALAIASSVDAHKGHTQPVPAQWNYSIDPATGVATATYPGNTKILGSCITGCGSGTGDPKFTTDGAGHVTISGMQGASQSDLLFNGSLFTGGSGTTTFPHIYINLGGTAPTDWSVNGTIFGFNAPSGFTGNFLQFEVNGGGSVFSVDNVGDVTIPQNINLGGASSINFAGGPKFATDSAGSFKYQSTGGVNQAFIDIVGNNTFQLGPANAAAPVTSQLQGQGSRGGTDSNVGGGNVAIIGGLGTGTGTPSRVTLGAAAPAAPGTTQQSQVSVFQIDGNQHAKYLSAAIPVVSSCGTGSPTVTAGSTDVAGEVVIGTTATTCTITFKIAYTNPPFCVLNDRSVMANITSYTLTASAIVLTMTSNSGNVVDWVCSGA